MKIARRQLCPRCMDRLREAKLTYRVVAVEDWERGCSWCHMPGALKGVEIAYDKRT